MEQSKTLRHWFLWSLASLVFVAIYGTLMRYKIAFNFPYFDQKNLLHAHSHFAFGAWISHTLYCGLSAMITNQTGDNRRYSRYKWLIGLNLLASFGMLIAFTVQGYKAVSISFSTMTIVIAVLFCMQFFKDVKSLKLRQPAIPWAKAGLLLNVLSAIGPFALAYIIVSKNFHPDFYLASIYYYLHFQYSGWFFFGAMALAITLLPENLLPFRKYFNVFAITVIPTYVLSTLWAKPPMWLYTITVIATLAQLFAWFHLIVCLLGIAKKEKIKVDSIAKFLFYAAGLALTIKFVLQAISVIPSLSQLVFGFRPIVIAYLHLVLLGVYSLFLLAFALKMKWLHLNGLARYALIGFFAGVVLNESVLGIQGIAAFTYTPISHINELLFGVAAILLISACCLIISQFRKTILIP